LSDTSQEGGMGHGKVAPNGPDERGAEKTPRQTLQPTKLFSKGGYCKGGREPLVLKSGVALKRNGFMGGSCGNRGFRKKEKFTS